ncbi:hypothetical protein E2C01_014354 [Portunus trituberculatus]|uniref:Uncharacterized protein n=1 Tax=Portunus trituberculatus TaxID=210409 RepID=A0A5B7DIK8_PORTR|nr:hypothetical protein [Portunus trituberculatus]
MAMPALRTQQLTASSCRRPAPPGTSAFSEAGPELHIWRRFAPHPGSSKHARGRHTEVSFAEGKGLSFPIKFRPMSRCSAAACLPPTRPCAKVHLPAFTPLLSAASANLALDKTHVRKWQQRTVKQFISQHIIQKNSNMHTNTAITCTRPPTEGTRDQSTKYAIY